VKKMDPKKKSNPTLLKGGGGEVKVCTRLVLVYILTKEITSVGLCV